MKEEIMELEKIDFKKCEETISKMKKTSLYDALKEDYECIYETM